MDTLNSAVLEAPAEVPPEVLRALKDVPSAALKALAEAPSQDEAARGKGQKGAAATSWTAETDAPEVLSSQQRLERR
jgi:hypothetical protein